MVMVHMVAKYGNAEDGKAEFSKARYGLAMSVLQAQKYNLSNNAHSRRLFIMGAVFVAFVMIAIANQAALACSINIAGMKCSESDAPPESGSLDAAAKSETTHTDDGIARLLTAPHMSHIMDVADARHLLERAGIGAPPQEIAAMLGKTRADAVQSILDGYTVSPENRPDAWMLSSAPAHWAEGDMLNAEQQAFQIARDREIGELRNWWLKEMITTSSPQTERLALFWQNHFVTTYEGLNNNAVISLARQNLWLREMASGNFRALVKKIIRDPAMLDYLDNDRNRKESPNENLARELMELFTLGEGHYDEATVKEAARALTGFGFEQANDFNFQFNSWSHDENRKTLFGKSGRFDGDDLVDIILEQPAAAQFIATKFWRGFVSETYHDDAEIKAIADAFRSSDYEIKTVMAATLSSPAFWDEKSRGTIIKSPVDLLVGTVRTTGYVPQNWGQISSMTKNLGQQFYGQPNVAGWPGGAAWITPARLLNRWQAVERIMTMPTANKAVKANSNMANSNMAGGIDAGDMMMVAGARTAQVRIASEDYYGPPRWSITLMKGKFGVWSSNIMNAPAGHDTVKFGRIQDDSELNWHRVTVPVDYDGEFDQIKVKFWNDHAGNDGDRNLFVEAVQIDGDIYPASLGKKQTSCRNDGQKPWALWCGGDLILTDALQPETPEIRPADDADRLYIGKVRFVWASEPPSSGKKKNAEISIGLQNLRFNGREWDHVILKFQKHRRDGVLLKLQSSECMPDCLTRWPNSAWVDKGRKKYGTPKRTIAIALNGNSPDNHYGSLAREDKMFVGALWSAFPALINQIGSGQEARRRATRLQGWTEWTESLSKRHASSRHAKLNLPEPVFEGLSNTDGMMMMMAGGAERGLQPAGRPALGSWDDFEVPDLLKPFPKYSWLLASTPVAADLNSDDIAQLLADPVFQLK